MLSSDRVPIERDVGLGVVPVEQRRLDVRGRAVQDQVPGGRGDGVAGVLHVGHAVVVTVDAVPAGLLGRRVDGGAAPGVPGGAADVPLVVRRQAGKEMPDNIAALKQRLEASSRATAQ
jgi:hypothetical protein